MTGLVGAELVRAGCWASPWPAEDGGPDRRQRLPTGRSLTGSWTSTSRECFGANMVVLREPGEVFLQGNTFGPDTTAWVERLHPESLAPERRSPDLPGGPFWAGGVVAHADGLLYVTYGRWCHALDPETLTPTASRDLPRERPYNSLVVLPDGTLVMKDFSGDTPLHPAGPDPGSELVALAPGTLEVVDRLVLPEGSIARLSVAVDEDGTASVVVVGDEHLHVVGWHGQRFVADEAPRRYVTMDGQTHGWDAVVEAGAAWFLDDGDGSTAFGPSFRGKGTNTAPLHLVRVDLLDRDAPPTMVEICGQPGGLIANPPVVDAQRGIAMGYDSGNGVVAAFSLGADGVPEADPRWRRDQDHAGHLLLDADAGLVVTFDFDHERGQDQAVVLDLDTGAEVSRTDTGSAVQTVLFPAPGWSDDLYGVSFTTVTRLHPR